MTDFDPQIDARGSFDAAIRAIGERVRSGQAPTPASGYFASSRPLRPGDKVRLNARNVGKVLRLVGDMAEIVEHEILGRRAVWRIQSDALVRITE
jgi:hypothetical protein